MHNYLQKKNVKNKQNIEMDLNYLKKFVSNYNETRSKTSLKNVRIPHRKF